MNVFWYAIHVSGFGKHVLHFFGQIFYVSAESDRKYGDGGYDAQTNGGQVRRHVEHHAHTARCLYDRSEAVAQILRYGQANYFSVRT